MNYDILHGQPKLPMVITSDIGSAICLVTSIDLDLM